ncbi:MAG: hypothetical protein V4525_15825 [Pseudomonadota bacterium]
MLKTLTNKFTLLGFSIVLAGCASLPPVLFQLIDDHSNTYAGFYDSNDRHISVAINKKQFNGFYIVSRGTTAGTALVGYGRRIHAVDTFSEVTSNSAKAYMSAVDGEKITCDFLFEGRQAVGECKSSFGKQYQFVADGK